MTERRLSRRGARSPSVTYLAVVAALCTARVFVSGYKEHVKAIAAVERVTWAASDILKGVK
jgi:hypothetical protein